MSTSSGNSTFTWLAFSDAERRRANDAISLLQDRDTRDELGLGGIRDAFSDLLFPGTSTIQTRAGYFLFIPWIYRQIEKEAGANARVRAQRAEQRLIPVLSASDDPDGTIGIRAGPDVQRLPSSVYWQGLFTWGIRRARASLGTYHAWLDHPLRRRRERDDDGSPIEDAPESAWDPLLPWPDETFPEVASFSLSATHAGYLRDRILLEHGSTMLAALVDLADPSIEAPAPWAHPVVPHLSATVRETLDHAELFSLVAHGSALLYNLRAAERAQGREQVDRYRASLDEWASEMRSAGRRLDSWSLERFWELAREGNRRIRSDAERFFTDWQKRVIPTRGIGLANDDDAKRRLTRREISVKGEKSARLANAAALARWGGESGAERMRFRWSSVQRVTRDIREPIARASAN